MYCLIKAKHNLFWLLLIFVVLVVFTGCHSEPSEYPCLVNFGIDVFPIQTSGFTDPEFIWSPDSRHILYRDSNQMMHIIPANNDEDNNTYQVPQILGRAFSWSPNTPQITFWSRDESTGRLITHLFDLDAGIEQRINADTQYDYTAPLWSPDGNHLAFGRERANDVGLFSNALQIYLLNVHDRLKDPIQITDDKYPAYMGAWSPDSSKIAYLLNTPSGTQLHTVSVADVVSTPLTTFEPCQEDPSWSPDSQQLVFASSHTGNWDLYIAPIEEGTPLNLTNTQIESEFEPVWSPNEQLIAFVRFIPISNTQAEQDLYLVRSDGKDEVRLTTSDLYETNPQWSPDGKSLAFLSTDGQSWYLEMINADGNERRKLATVGHR